MRNPCCGLDRGVNYQTLSGLNSGSIVLSKHEVKSESDSVSVRKLTYSVSAATAPHAVDEWRDNLSQVVETSISEADKPHFQARLSASAVGYALFMETESCPQIIARPQNLIRSNEFDYLSICVVQSGRHHADYNGTSVSIKPGDVLFTHHARPNKGIYSSFRCLRLHIPRSTAPAFLRDRDFNGTILDASLPGAGLLTQHIQSVWSTLTELSESEITASVEAAFLMATGSLQADVSLLPDHRNAIERTLKSSIQSFIAERLGDPRLGPVSICSHFRVSKSKLYRLFEMEGGIVSYITGCRLDQCWRALQTAGYDAGPISSLAYACGFSHDVSFSRAFRRRFGASPSEVREAGASIQRQNAGGDLSQSPQAKILGWYHGLAAPPGIAGRRGTPKLA